MHSICPANLCNSTNDVSLPGMHDRNRHTWKREREVSDVAGTTSWSSREHRKTEGNTRDRHERVKLIAISCYKIRNVALATMVKIHNEDDWISRTQANALQALGYSHVHLRSKPVAESNRRWELRRLEYSARGRCGHGPLCGPFYAKDRREISAKIAL